MTTKIFEPFFEQLAADVAEFEAKILTYTEVLKMAESRRGMIFNADWVIDAAGRCWRFNSTGIDPRKPYLVGDFIVGVDSCEQKIKLGEFDSRCQSQATRRRLPDGFRQVQLTDENAWVKISNLFANEDEFIRYLRYIRRANNHVILLQTLIRRRVEVEAYIRLALLVSNDVKNISRSLVDKFGNVLGLTIMCNRVNNQLLYVELSGKAARVLQENVRDFRAEPVEQSDCVSS